MQNSPANSIWGKTATELLERPEPARLSLPEFQSLCADFVDRILWDRWSDEEIFDALQLRAKYHNKKITPEDGRELIQARRDAHEKSGFELPEPVRPDTENLPHYIVPWKDKNYKGWFPRGTVSLVAGSSGLGKTTMLTYLLEDIRAGRPVLEHPAAPADYRFALVDRSLGALRETLEDKGLDTEAIVARSVEVSHEDGAAHKVLARLLRKWKEQDGTTPDIVVLEGIDFWVRKITDFDAVYQFIKKLEPVAEAWNVALVATIGCPKLKLKDGFRMTRDNVIGTSAWGRTCSTVLYLDLVGDTDERSVTIMPRNGRTEHMYFRFEEGQAIFSNMPRLEAGLKTLNERHPDTHEDELASMAARIEKMTPGAQFPASIFDGIPKPLRTTRLYELASRGLVERRRERWYKK